MGPEGRPVARALKSSLIPPQADEIEMTLFGPGYGECVLIHLGNHKWAIVDSCFNRDHRPAALAYLRNLGLNPSEAVSLIVATHWHDDHIRGMGEVVEVCDKAAFCCASALGAEEFLAALAALERRPAMPAGSGLRELYKVFSLLAKRSSTCTYAISNRLIFDRDDCMIWSLTPSDRAFNAFLQQAGSLLPRELEAKRRIPALTPNEAAVVLLVRVSDTTILLGADLERRGWLEVLDTYRDSNRTSSAFKVPHHGSQDAHEDRVWNEILTSDPVAVLTPWRRGGRRLPTENDLHRILSFTSRAYVTTSRTDVVDTPVRRKSNTVERSIRETGARIRTVNLSDGMIRLRKRVSSLADWNIERFGSACSLTDYANSPP